METASLIVYFCAESSVPLTAVQRRDEPTRDVYVTRDESGDREFAGTYISSTVCGLRVCTAEDWEFAGVYLINSTICTAQDWQRELRRCV